MMLSGFAAVAMLSVIPQPRMVSECGALPPEGYRLVVSNRVAQIESPSAAGRFYAMQTLKQLDLDQNVVINDYPTHQWRGLMLDVSRHFFTVEQVCLLMDEMASLKMNRLHLHLTDGPGWRIEIKRYPKLTEVGAWRIDKTDQPWVWRDTEMGKPGKLYGGFYTANDIATLVAYARARYITIVPEIEVPGHSFAAMMAYPELACPSNNVPVDGLRGKDALCIGNPKTLEFYKGVLDEVMAMFPDSPIHLGGDEVPREVWAKCPLCSQTRPEALTRALGDYVRAQGRTPIVWNDTPNPDPTQVMTVWTEVRDTPTSILCPAEFCYLDYYQGSPKTEPLAIGGYIPLEKVYSFKVPRSVMGVQGNCWTEFLPNFQKLRYMLFPRLIAIAELGWGTPTTFEDFQKRLKVYQQAHPLTTPAKPPMRP